MQLRDAVDEYLDGRRAECEGVGVPENEIYIRTRVSMHGIDEFRVHPPAS